MPIRVNKFLEQHTKQHPKMTQIPQLCVIHRNMTVSGKPNTNDINDLQYASAKNHGDIQKQAVSGEGTIYGTYRLKSDPLAPPPPPQTPPVVI